MTRPAKRDKGILGERGILGEAAGLSIGAMLAALAAFRRGKAFHPDGVVHEARLSIPGTGDAPAAAELLSRRGEHRAVAWPRRGPSRPQRLGPSFTNWDHNQGVAPERFSAQRRMDAGIRSAQR